MCLTHRNVPADFEVSCLRLASATCGRLVATTTPTRPSIFYVPGPGLCIVDYAQTGYIESQSAAFETEVRPSVPPFTILFPGVTVIQLIISFCLSIVICQSTPQCVHFDRE